jgi:hypothetical protein
LGPGGNCHHKVIILGIRIPNEFSHGCALGLDFIGHALAEIQNQAHRDWPIFGRKVRDLLPHTILVDREILFLEVGDRMVHHVGDRDRYLNQIDVDSQWLPVIFKPRFTIDANTIGLGCGGVFDRRTAL